MCLHTWKQSEENIKEKLSSKRKSKEMFKEKSITSQARKKEESEMKYVENE